MPKACSQTHDSKRLLYLQVFVVAMNTIAYFCGSGFHKHSGQFTAPPLTHRNVGEISPYIHLISHLHVFQPWEINTKLSVIEGGEQGGEMDWELGVEMFHGGHSSARSLLLKAL